MAKKISYKQFKKNLQSPEQIPDDPIHLIPSSLAQSCTAPISEKTNPAGDLPGPPEALYVGQSSPYPRINDVKGNPVTYIKNFKSFKQLQLWENTISTSPQVPNS